MWCLIGRVCWGVGSSRIKQKILLSRLCVASNAWRKTASVAVMCQKHMEKQGNNNLVKDWPIEGVFSTSWKQSRRSERVAFFVDFFYSASRLVPRWTPKPSIRLVNCPLELVLSVARFLRGSMMCLFAHFVGEKKAMSTNKQAELCQAHISLMAKQETLVG